MASRIHCDCCDDVVESTEETFKADRPTKTPRQHIYRQKVDVRAQVFENQGSLQDKKLDLCRKCRREVMADAFGLVTPELKNELQDQLYAAVTKQNAYEAALTSIALGGIDIEKAIGIARLAVPHAGQPTTVDNEIPF